MEKFMDLTRPWEADFLYQKRASSCFFLFFVQQLPNYALARGDPKSLIDFLYQ